MEKESAQKGLNPQPAKKKYIQKMIFQPKVKQTKVVNVKVKFLRQLGYQSFLQWGQNPDHVYIGRNMAHYVDGAKASKWANPFKVQQQGRDGCIQKYRQYILSNKQLLADLPSLKGKTLGCWCKPQGCHGDVLAELAEKYQDFINKQK